MSYAVERSNGSIQQPTSPSTRQKVMRVVVIAVNALAALGPIAGVIINRTTDGYILLEVTADVYSHLERLRSRITGSSSTLANIMDVIRVVALLAGATLFSKEIANGDLVIHALSLAGELV